MQNSQRSTRYRTVCVLLIGHSYIRRLQEFMSSSPQLLNFGLSGVQVRCIGVGGATLGQRRCIRRHLRAVSVYHPDIIFVHIGENDLGRMSNSNIVHHLLHFVSDLSRLCSSNIVIVGQLIFFPRTIYEYSVNCINEQLSFEIQEPYIFWRHRRGFSRSATDVFLSDRVHLNNIGMLRYFRSIRQ